MLIQPNFFPLASAKILMYMNFSYWKNHFYKWFFFLKNILESNSFKLKMIFFFLIKIKLKSKPIKKMLIERKKKYFQEKWLRQSLFKVKLKCGNKVLISLKLFLRILKLQFQFIISSWNSESGNDEKKKSK